MKQKILSLLSRFTKPVYGGLGSILMFHRVSPEPYKRVPGQSSLEITPQRFEEIILFLKDEGYQFLSLDEIHNILQTREKTGKFISITFDDGYLDNYTHAYPILKKHGIPFAIYVATSFPERQAVLWWYMLDDLILTHDELQFEVSDQKLNFDCSTIGGKKHASLELRKLIKFAKYEEYHPILESVFLPYGIDLYAKTAELAMSWEQINTISSDELVTIGSHSINHYILKTLPDEIAHEEILQSKTEIEKHINRPVHHFAYPYGEKNEAGYREFEIVKEIGFKTAVTTRAANIFYAHADHCEALPRLDMPSFNNFAQFKLAVNGLTPCRKYRFKRVITY